MKKLSFLTVAIAILAAGGAYLLRDQIPGLGQTSGQSLSAPVLPPPPDYEALSTVHLREVMERLHYTEEEAASLESVLLPWKVTAHQERIYPKVFPALPKEKSDNKAKGADNGKSAPPPFLATLTKRHAEEREKLAQGKITPEAFAEMEQSLVTCLAKRIWAKLAGNVGRFHDYTDGHSSVPLLRTEVFHILSEIIGISQRPWNGDGRMGNLVELPTGKSILLDQTQKQSQFLVLTKSYQPEKERLIRLPEASPSLPANFQFWTGQRLSSFAYVSLGFYRQTEKGPQDPLVKTDFEKARDFDPSFVSPPRYLGILCLELEQFEEAEGYLTEAIDVSTNETTTLLLHKLRRKCRLALGENELAQADLAAIENKDPAWSARRLWKPEVVKLAMSIGYPEETGQDIVRICEEWQWDNSEEKDTPLEERLLSQWAYELAAARTQYQNEGSLEALVSTEQTVGTQLCKLIAEKLEYDRDKIDLEDFIKDRKGQCVTHSQLYLFLGQSLGLNLRPIEVPEHITVHLILSDDKTILLETTSGRKSVPFSLKELYRKEGNHWVSTQEDKLPVKLYKKFRYTDLEGSMAGIYSNRGSRSNRLEDYSKALANCSKAIELDPKYANAYSHRGKTYNDLKDYRKALADYSQAIELDPKYAKAYFGRGNTYRYLKDYRKALADYSQAIELDPEFAEAYGARGKTLQALEDYPEALADFSKAIELDPKDAEAYGRRGIYHLKLENYPKALADFSKSIELDPKNADGYAMQARIYYLYEDYEKAVSECTKAINFDPKNALAHFIRGSCHQQLKDNHKALADYRKAAELDPSGQNAKTALTLINQLSR